MYNSCKRLVDVFLCVFNRYLEDMCYVQCYVYFDEQVKMNKFWEQLGRGLFSVFS